MPWVYVTQGFCLGYVTDFGMRGPAICVTDFVWVRWMGM